LQSKEQERKPLTYSGARPISIPVASRVVLTVTYPGGRTRQFSVRRERAAEVRRWLSNYQDLKEAIETVCELNHDLLRPEWAASKRRRKQHD
jgi:hypothetical protein